MHATESYGQDAPVSTGRRERNKQEKRERITSAARSLFALKGVNDVTTNEVAELADVASGTVFLYAKSKSELLLLAQNASYQEAHELGLAKSQKQTGVLGALVALLSPIVHCNREHVENGRAYLQAVVFGTGAEQHRREALELMQGTETAVAELLMTRKSLMPGAASEKAKVIMAVLFLALASPENVDVPVDGILTELEKQLNNLL